MTCPCPVFRHQSKGVRITFHPGRAQAFTVWKSLSGHEYSVYGFYATLEAAQEWL